MSMPKSEERALVAIAEQCAETRRPIKTMIVMAALNVKTGAPADALLVDLCSLKRQGLITQHGDAWEATVEGHQLARRLMVGQVAPTTDTPGASSTACDDQWLAGEERMELIGPNGPTGDHYPESHAPGGDQ